MIGMRQYQSRMIRKGQNTKIHYVSFDEAGKIDERIFEMLKNKETLMKISTPTNQAPQHPLTLEEVRFNERAKIKQAIEEAEMLAKYNQMKLTALCCASIILTGVIIYMALEVTK